MTNTTPLATGSVAQRWRLAAAALTIAVLASTVWLAAPSLAATYGPYNIRAVHSGKCMEVRGAGSMANGVLVQQWGCAGPFQANQQWYFTETGDDRTYYVWSKRSRKCLGVRGGALGDRALLEQWRCINYVNQRWSMPTPSIGGPFELRAAHSGKCADVIGGTGAVTDGIPLQQWSCNGQTNQQWYLTNP